MSSNEKHKRVVLYNVYAKDDDSDREGFTRPVLITLWEGDHHLRFRNQPATEKMAWRERHLSPETGVVDRFMRHVLGLFPDSTEVDRDRYAAATTHLCSQSGGRFEHIFLLGWLRRYGTAYRYDKYDFQIVARQSAIARIEIWPKGLLGDRAARHWIFHDHLPTPQEPPETPFRSPYPEY